MPDNTDTNRESDFLHGAAAIAKFRNEPKRRTYYLLERGLLPAAKLGDSWEASKERLREHQRELEDANLARGRDA